ncbi:developmentally-regulated GTP-binding protein 2-like [Ochotona princeps]|uniref:developmentally-regulated GTP-binding protein 2-like n=1 Tax=Ochotona princeps TaxID=9978 RepID=UPI002714BA49|nr:developmentally-regulated GTP-binding protein 2-like [Ochotona princeps]
MPCLYVYNKIDQISMEEVDRLARKPNCVGISCGMKLNLDYLLEMLWEALALTCIYTKKRGQRPDFSDAIILRRGPLWSMCATAFTGRSPASSSTPWCGAPAPSTARSGWASHTPWNTRTSSRS